MDGEDKLKDFSRVVSSRVNGSRDEEPSIIDGKAACLDTKRRYRTDVVEIILNDTNEQHARLTFLLVDCEGFHSGQATTNIPLTFLLCQSFRYHHLRAIELPSQFFPLPAETCVPY